MSEAMTTLERTGEIGILTMKRGVTNALNLDLVEELNTHLTEIKNDDSIRGVVLESSNDKFFCIGLDIPQLISLPRADFEHFYRSVNLMNLALYSLPVPTIAAISGHAIAGGCILCLVCDYRFIAEGRKLMGLNEIQLGVPVPYIADRILVDLVGTRYSREIMEMGDFYTPEQTLQMGMVDEVHPLDELRAAAREKIEKLAQMPAPAYTLIKNHRIEGIVRQVTQMSQESEVAFVDRWYAEDTRRRLKAAVAKF